MDLKYLLENYTNREIWMYLDRILETDIDVNELIEIEPPYNGYFVDHHEKLLEAGADASNLFIKARPRYEELTDFPEMLARDLKTFVDYGLDKKVAKAWLEANIKKEEFVVHSKDFEYFEIDPEDYIDSYLDNYDPLMIWNKIIYGIAPEVITPEVFVEHYSIDDISSAFRYHSSKINYGFSVFIEEYCGEAGNMDLLAKKVLEAYGGYPKNEDKLVVLANLLVLGAKVVDPNKIIDSLTFGAYNYNDKESIETINNYFYDRLQYDADNAHLDKLKPCTD